VRRTRKNPAPGATRRRWPSAISASAAPPPNRRSRRSTRSATKRSSGSAKVAALPRPASTRRRRRRRHVYLWVEDGTPRRRAQPDPGRRTARRAGRCTAQKRQLPAGGHRPGIGALSDPSNLLPIPDVDNDPHLYILTPAISATAAMRSSTRRQPSWAALPTAPARNALHHTTPYPALP